MSERKLLEAIRMRELVKALKESKDEIANLRAVMIKCADKLDDTFIEHPVADTLREAAK